MKVPPDRPAVRILRAIALGLACACGAWTLWLTAFGGFDTELLGVRLRSNQPLRPLLIAAASFLGFVSLGGRVQLPRFVLALVPRLSQAPAFAARWRPRERTVVLALGLAVTAFGLTYATTVAGGADSYGYVSQADLWLAGDLRVDQPWVEEATWPSRRWSFAPLGYRARTSDFAIVPTYAPGLALLMAGAKSIGGQEAVFWVVPLLGGVLVLATYGVARRMAPPDAAVIAAALIATCPAMIYMLVAPMSDVPATALWMVACYGVLRPTLPAAAGGGLAAGLAVLVRPNLAFIAGLLAAWPAWQAARSREGRGRAILRLAVFSVGAAAGLVAVAAINRYLYGSPTESGYGDLASLFDTSHLWPNLVKYATWLVASETLAGAAGAAALVLPLRRLWPDPEHRRFLVIAASITGSVWLSYCFYLEFDAWWFLRFMLPVLPLMAIGTAAVVVASLRSSHRTVRAAAIVVLGLVIVHQVRFAVDSSALDAWRSERRYVGVGRLVRERTPDNSVIISNQHSGSIRYYGGRMTLRYENLDGESLDEAIGWMSSRGLETYLAVEAWEIPQFEERFKGQASLVRLETPLVVYEGPSTVFLFDMVRPASGEPATVVDHVEGLRSAGPVPPATIVLRPPASRP